MKQPYRDMGARIRKTRRLKDLTQQQVAEAVHVSVQSVSQWETGKTRPDRDRLTALAEFLGVHPDFLQDNEDKPVDKAGYPYVMEDLQFIVDRFVYKIPTKGGALGFAGKTGLRDFYLDSIIIAQKPPVGRIFAYEFTPDDAVGQDFKIGDLVIVDTGLPFRIGDVVMVFDSENDDIRFMQVRGTRLNDIDRTIVDLRPLAPDQSDTSMDFDEPDASRVLGTVVEHRRVRGG